MSDDTAGSDNPMLALFRSELTAHTKAFLEGVTQLRSDQGSSDTIDSVLATIRSIRGTAKIMQLTSLADLGGALGDLLASAQKDKTSISSEHLHRLGIAGEALQKALTLDDDQLAAEDTWGEEYRHTVKHAVATVKGEPLIEKQEEGSSQTPKLEESSEGVLVQLREHSSFLSRKFAGTESPPENDPQIYDACYESVELLLSLPYESMTSLAKALHRLLGRNEDNTSDVINRWTYVKEATELVRLFSREPLKETSAWVESHEETIKEITLKLEIPETSLPCTEAEPPVEASSSEEPEEPASKIMDDDHLLGLFFVDLEAQTLSLNEGLLAIEADAYNTEALQNLMRAAHSIKGAARVMGLHSIIELAHALEDAFSEVQEDPESLDEGRTDVMLAAVDLLTSLTKLGNININAWVQSQSETIAGFVSELSGKPMAKAPKSPSPKAQACEKQAKQTATPSKENTPPSSTATPAQPKPSAPPSQPDPTPKPTHEASGQRLKQAQQHTPPNAQNRVVRLSADYLTQLMGLAGELLVESRWLHPFSESLMQLKKTQYELSGLVDLLRANLDAKVIGEEGEQLLLDMQQQTQGCRESLTDHLDQLESFIRRHATLSDRLYREVIASRMCPFGEGVDAFPRMVRDLGKQLGKKLRFEIIGRSTSIDRDILDKLKAPLNHLIRNAVDHGLESAEERQALGKDPVGRICLEARHKAGVLCITVSDDGKGIDIEDVRKKIVDRKHVDAGMAEHLTQAELLDFLFLPGFSTNSEVNEISGRGVGLNVVQNMVHDVSGQIRVTGEKNKGATFHLQLPLTLSVLRALLVEIGGDSYAFPLARIERSMVIDREMVQAVESREYYNFEGQNIGLIPGHQVLELEEGTHHTAELSMVVLSDGFNSYGVVVDRLLGERELVVQELDPRLGKVSNIACGAFMEDGSPILVIDVEDMVRSVDKLLSGGTVGHVGDHEEASDGDKRKRILVVDDSITVREVECRILENQGYEVDVAVNGVDGWNTVRIGEYDLIITDVDMPRMNGIELVRHIKGDARLRDLPVMIVSYKERSQDRMLGLEAGANYYLAKSSFHDDRFLDAVKDLIGEAVT